MNITPQKGLAHIGSLVNEHQDQTPIGSTVKSHLILLFRGTPVAFHSTTYPFQDKTRPKQPGLSADTRANRSASSCMREAELDNVSELGAVYILSFHQVLALLVWDCCDSMRQSAWL